MCQHTEICQVDALKLSHPPMWDSTEIHPSAVAWLSLTFWPKALLHWLHTVCSKKSWLYARNGYQRLARTSNRLIQGYNPQHSSSIRVNCVRWGALTFGTNGLKCARWSFCDCCAATKRQLRFLIVPPVVDLILQILLSVLTLGQTQKQRFEMIHANVMFLRNV